jgi:uncharacterized protein DUF6288
MLRTLCTRVLLFALVATPVFGQVHYHADGAPWKQTVGSGPDADVPGWFYNLGTTGLRVELREDRPEALLVRYVLPGSIAEGRIEVGDWILGQKDEPWTTPHQNGYGMEKFGPQGPIDLFATALHASLQDGKSGRLDLLVEREGEPLEVRLRLGTKTPTYSATFPADCKKSEAHFEALCDALVAQQREDGSWGSPVQDTFAPLALLGSDKPAHKKAAKAAARFHARTTGGKDERWLVNWYYTSAGIVLSEYYLQTKEKWVLAELQEIYDFLYATQYMNPDQINPKSHETHPHAVPKKPGQKEGGWGHNPGFEGYGPIQMITAQAALALALMKDCGIEVDRERHEAAYAFLRRGTGKNGYVWYGDQVAGDSNWADMGRTGAAGLAHARDPWSKQGAMHALAHAEMIGGQPLSFPDTHGSPLMGMGFAAAAAWQEPAAFRKLMDANRWWFSLSECADGSFYYQPNRDNAGYGPESRLQASAVTAFIFSIPRSKLRLLQRKP